MRVAPIEIPFNAKANREKMTILIVNIMLVILLLDHYLLHQFQHYVQVIPSPIPFIIKFLFGVDVGPLQVEAEVEGTRIGMFHDIILAQSMLCFYCLLFLALWFICCVCFIIFFSFTPGAPLTPAPNIIDIIKRESEGEEERKHDKGVLLFTPALKVIEGEGEGINCVCCLFDLLSDTFAPLFGAGSATVIGVFAAQFAALLCKFIGVLWKLFESSFAALLASSLQNIICLFTQRIGAYSAIKYRLAGYTTHNNELIQARACGVVYIIISASTDDCFEQEKNERLSNAVFFFKLTFT